MWVIFAFSHQPKYETEQYSALVIAFLKFLHLNLNEWTMGGGTFIVRKMAHITEYFILCVLAIRFQNQYFPTFSKLLAVFLCLLYAASDEFHQTFVFGRVGCFSDVCIDMIGVLAYYFYVLRQKKATT